MKRKHVKLTAKACFQPSFITNFKMMQQEILKTDFYILFKYHRDQFVRHDLAFGLQIETLVGLKSALEFLWPLSHLARIPRVFQILQVLQIMANITYFVLLNFVAANNPLLQLKTSSFNGNGVKERICTFQIILLCLAPAQLVWCHWCQQFSLFWFRLKPMTNRKISHVTSTVVSHWSKISSQHQIKLRVWKSFVIFSVLDFSWKWKGEKRSWRKMWSIFLKCRVKSKKYRKSV